MPTARPAPTAANRAFSATFVAAAEVILSGAVSCSSVKPESEETSASALSMPTPRTRASIRTGAVWVSKATCPTGGRSSTVSEVREGRTCTLAVSGPTSTGVAGTSSTPTTAPSTATTTVELSCHSRARRRRLIRWRRRVSSGGPEVSAAASRAGEPSTSGAGSCPVGCAPWDTPVSAEAADAAGLLEGDLHVGDLRAGNEDSAVLVVDEGHGRAVRDGGAETLEQRLGLLLGLHDDLARGVLDADSDLHDLTSSPP